MLRYTATLPDGTVFEERGEGNELHFAADEGACPPVGMSLCQEHCVHRSVSVLPRLVDIIIICELSGIKATLLRSSLLGLRALSLCRLSAGLWAPGCKQHRLTGCSTASQSLLAALHDQQHCWP